MFLKSLHVLQKKKKKKRYYIPATIPRCILWKVKLFLPLSFYTDQILNPASCSFFLSLACKVLSQAGKEVLTPRNAHLSLLCSDTAP